VRADGDTFDDEAVCMIEQQPLAIGTRVRLRSPSRMVVLRSKLGHIARPDVWDGYYIVRLDEPALYHESAGSVQELTEIREAGDNLEIVLIDSAGDDHRLDHSND